MRTRKAILPDAGHIHELIAGYSGDGTLLPRTLAEICENVRDFVVLEDDGRIIGCGALHLYGTHLAEIRSITVAPWAQGRGGGGRLVKALMAEAKRHRVDCICLFTRKPDFFAGQGFTVAQREDIPDKIYKDCHACPRFHCCDEVALGARRVAEVRDPPRTRELAGQTAGMVAECGEFDELQLTRGLYLAAKRRENKAHGVSRGWSTTRCSPSGAEEDVSSTPSEAL